MHSSRMRTVRNSSRLLGGCLLPGGISAPGGGTCLVPGGVSAPGGAWSRGVPGLGGWSRGVPGPWDGGWGWYPSMH